MPNTGPEVLLPARLDHTLLRPTATAAEISQLCEEAVEFGFASVCIPPRFVPLAARLLYGSDVCTGTVIGFPCGYTTLEVKCQEARQAVAAGARELDMVLPLGPALSGDLPQVEAELSALVQAVPEAEVKVILECCYLADPLKEALVESVVRAGAAYVKTSSGFGPAGATVEDVRLLQRVAAGRIRVKAAGGIRDLETCRIMLAAGADRIGTSQAVAIVQQWQREESA
jgi:deoxyribose-phosphate aldolase